MALYRSASGMGDLLLDLLLLPWKFVEAFVAYFVAAVPPREGDDRP